MGEGIPFWLQRIDNRYKLEVKIGAVRKLDRLPSEHFRDNFYWQNATKVLSLA